MKQINPLFESNQIRQYFQIVVVSQVQLYRIKLCYINHLILFKSGMLIQQVYHDRKATIRMISAKILLIKTSDKLQ